MSVYCIVCSPPRIFSHHIYGPLDPLLPFPPPFRLVTTTGLSVPESQFYIPHECNRTVLSFLWLTYLALRTTLKVYPCCRKWQYFIFSYGWVVSHCIYGPYLLHPIPYRRVLGCLHVLATVNNAAMNTGVHICVFLQINVFNFFRQITRRGIAGSYSNSIIFEELPYYVPQWLCKPAFPPAVTEGSFFSTISATLITCLVDNSHSNR